MRQLRVLHIVQNLNYGGMERLIADMVRLCDRDRFDPHVLTLQYMGRFSNDMTNLATLHTAPPMSRSSYLYPRSLAKTIADIGADVVHTHSGVWLKAARAARIANVPLVVHTEHGRRAPDPYSDRVIDKVASRYTDFVVAVSEKLSGHLRDRVVSDSRRIRVIANGVDTQRFRPGRDDGSLRTELDIPPQAKIIGSVGRLEPIKGYEVAVQALVHLTRIREDVPNAVLVVMGDGSQRQALEELAESLGVASHVRWLGWRDDISRLHAASAVFTMSSHSEGTSISLLEAMSAGLCPVVTDVGGNAAVLGPDLQHRLVPANDPAALARAWDSAISNGTSCERDGECSRIRVREYFSIEEMVSKYEAIYRTASRRGLKHHHPAMAAQ